MVADVLEGPGGFDQGSAQRFEPLVQRMVAGLDEAVGVEGEQGALLELHLDLLEGFAADAERHAGRDVEEQRRFARLDDDGGQVAGVGEGAAPGDRVVDGVDARRQIDLGEVRLA